METLKLVIFHFMHFPDIV